ncbi:hypothetical protein JXA88_13190 [Candidatus Fermentibacteria bacterium]|nr:hypothetical protein [Candidatus Fermentibacteria bacterium]
MRRTVPLMITFIVGLTLILAVFIPPEPFDTMNREFSVYFDIIAVFAFVLGGGNLLRLHGDRVYRRGKDWKFSIVTLAGFAVTLVVGLGKIGGPPGVRGDLMAPGTWFRFVFNAVLTPLSATMFALLAFYVASASFRAFRAKTPEATILLVSGFIILLGRTFLGGILTGWLPDSLSFLTIPNLADWIMAWPNTAGQRAIVIGIALGVTATSLRLILGIERGYLGSD